MADSNQQGAGSLPEINFSTFILSLASSTLVHLGEVPNPATGKTEASPMLAKHAIDTLSMLQEKTTRGLTSDEQNLLSSVLYELKMKYVCLSEKNKSN